MATSIAPENEENVEFYRLMYTKKPFVCKKAITCVWGKTFEIGDFIIEGTYYQKYGTGHDTCFSTKVTKGLRCSRKHMGHEVPMLLADYCVSSNDLVYKLQAEVEEAILEYA